MVPKWEPKSQKKRKYSNKNWIDWLIDWLIANSYILQVHEDSVGSGPCFI